MLSTPERRRRRLADIREKVIGRRTAALRDAATDAGDAYIDTVLLDGSARPATSEERATWADGEPHAELALDLGPATAAERAAFGADAVIARPRVVPAPPVPTRAETMATPREHRSPSKSRTISRRARTSATSTADPSSSRPRGGTRPLRSVRIETTRLALRLALLVIGGAR